MAEMQKFEGATIKALPPSGLDEMIGTAYVFHNGVSCVYAWKPTPEDLERWNAGEFVFVSVMLGTQQDGSPAIAPMYVGHEDDCKAVVSDTGKVW